MKTELAQAAILACILVAPFSHAQDLRHIPGLVGTMEVSHHRQQVGGVLEGCSMVFRAVFLDFAYRQGRPAVIAGNFTFYVQGPGAAFLTIKAGVKDLMPADAPIEAPANAYVQTKNGTSASAKGKAADSDMAGFRMWVLPITEKISALIGDVLDGKEVTLGISRKPGGLDVLIPLDLSVVETITTTEGGLKRKRSTDSLRQFTECFIEVSERLRQ